MEPEKKFYDRSPWHHLVFVEELTDDVSDRADCILCWEQAVGPVYKCFECSFIQHRSCPKPTKRDWEEKMKIHCYWPRHHLILAEEVENRVEGVVCWGCEEPPSLPAYKCSFPRCTFLLHKCCAEVSHVVLLPPHSDHLFTLEITKGECRFCFKTMQSLNYHSQRFKFSLHNKCLLRLLNFADDCHEHKVWLKGLVDRFFCEACGEETMGFSYTCSICHLTIERDCCDFSHTIRTTLHDHYLTFTHSVRRVNKQERVICRLCRKQVNTRYGAYYCVKCGFILHLKCARKYENKNAMIDSASSNCNEFSIYLVEGLKIEEAKRIVGPEKIQHFNHPQHELILSHEHPGYYKQCEACMRFIFFPLFYGCEACKFFLHSRCAELPTTIKRGLFHKHLLTLIPRAPSVEKIIWCRKCCIFRDGYAYKCDECDDFELDIQCGLIPEALEHPLHDHILYLVGRGKEPKGTCIGCDISKVNYVCIDGCKIKLCFRCATLPHVAKYQYHPHPLTLTDACDHSKEYYCLICEDRRDPKVWYYWCKECDFTVDLKCLLGDNFKSGYYESKYHQHPLTFLQKSENSPPCDTCGQPFGKRCSSFETWFDFLAVECTQCKFIMHRRHVYQTK